MPEEHFLDKNWSVNKMNLIHKSCLWIFKGLSTGCLADRPRCALVSLSVSY